MEGVCFAEIYKDVLSNQAQVNLQDYNGMYDKDCFCSTCKFRKEEHLNEQMGNKASSVRCPPQESVLPRNAPLRSEALSSSSSARCPPQESRLQGNAPLRSEALSSSSSGGCPPQERRLQRNAPLRSEAPLQPFAPGPQEPQPAARPAPIPIEHSDEEEVGAQKVLNRGVSVVVAPAQWKSQQYAVRAPYVNDVIMRLGCGQPDVDAFATEKTRDGVDIGEL